MPLSAPVQMSSPPPFDKTNALEVMVDKLLTTVYRLEAEVKLMREDNIALCDGYEEILNVFGAIADGTVQSDFIARLQNVRPVLSRYGYTGRDYGPVTPSKPRVEPIDAKQPKVSSPLPLPPPAPPSVPIVPMPTPLPVPAPDIKTQTGPLVGVVSLSDNGTRHTTELVSELRRHNKSAKRISDPVKLAHIAEHGQMDYVLLVCLLESGSDSGVRADWLETAVKSARELVSNKPERCVVVLVKPSVQAASRPGHKLIGNYSSGFDQRYIYRLYCWSLDQWLADEFNSAVVFKIASALQIV